MIWPCLWATFTGCLVHQRGRKIRKRRVQTAYNNGVFVGTSTSPAGGATSTAPAPSLPTRHSDASRAERIKRRLSRSWAGLAAKVVQSHQQHEQARSADLAGRERAHRVPNRYDDLERLSNEEIVLRRQHRSPSVSSRTAPPPPPPPNAGTSYTTLVVNERAKPAVPPKRGACAFQVIVPRFSISQSFFNLLHILCNFPF